MASITSLPPEILLEILLLSHNLWTLRQIIQTHSRLYSAFQGHRSFVIRAVFRGEIVRYGIGRKDVGNGLTMYGVWYAITRIEAIENKEPRPCPRHDLVMLRETFWPTLVSLLSSAQSTDSEKAYARKWGRALFHNYAQIPGQAHAALLVGEEVAKAVPRKDVSLKRQDREMANAMISLYRQDNRPREAFTLQESVLDRLDPDSPEGISWIKQLCKDYRAAGRSADEVALRTSLWETARATHGSRSSKALAKAKRVVRTNQELQQPAAAAEFQARIFAALEPGGRQYITWGRALIGMLKETRNSMNEVLVLRQEIWRHYLPDTDGYYPWARQMCLELRARGRENEAMKVEEDVWTAYQAHTARWGSGGAVSVQARSAASSLARAYRRRLQVAKAERIEAQLSTGRLRF